MSKDKITKEDIYELLSQEEDKELRIMKIDVEILSGDKFKLKTSFNERFLEVIGPYKQILLEISEDLYRCSNKELWNKLRETGYTRFTMIDVLIASNQLNNYIKLDVPVLRLHKHNKDNKKTIRKLSLIIEKLEDACKELTKNLCSFMEKYVPALMGAPTIDNYELILYFDGEELLYDGFVPTTDSPFYIEKFNIFKLMKDEDIMSEIEAKLKENSVKLRKNRAIKVTFDYNNKAVNNLNCCPLLMTV